MFIFKQYYLFILVLVLTACSDEEKVFLNTENFLPQNSNKLEYVFNFSKDTYLDSGKYITTISKKVDNCLEFKDKLILNNNKIANPASYKICLLNGNLIAKTINEEFMLISKSTSWKSKLFSYYPLPKNKIFMQKCKKTKTYKEKILNRSLDILEIECKYSNNTDTEITNIYKYASTMGMIEKTEIVSGVEIFNLKLDSINELQSKAFPQPKNIFR